MRRRSVLALGCASALAWPRVALTQIVNKPVRIGFIGTKYHARNTDAFKDGLSQLGYVLGENTQIEYRYAEGKVERFAPLASELVGLGVDLILATNSLAAIAARQATRTVPIVAPVMGDPIGDGLVDTLARPGGNITGLTFLGPELLPKRLALLKEGLPAISRIAALWHPGGYGAPTMDAMVKGAEATARDLGIGLRFVAVREPDELDRAFSVIAGESPDALIVFPSPMLFNELARIAPFATGRRLPGMAMSREFAEFGGLMAYGASLSDLHQRAAGYVDKILRGAKPHDLPVEQATTFELVVNLKAARALGLTIPPSLLARADEVID